LIGAPAPVELLIGAPAPVELLIGAPAPIGSAPSGIVGGPDLLDGPGAAE
jgi:hypothetical protein